jgi:mRNA-degrading endonuclease RelE of RelBE toxin-antitoxin system
MAKSQKRLKRSNRTPTENIDQSDAKNASAAYEVVLSGAAEAAYERFYRKAAEARDRGEPTSYHFTALNMIDEVLEKVIPRDPFNKRYALQGVLSGVFRMQKGRLRICWIGNSSERKVCVIFISESLRKQGDANDPYRLLTNMLLSGDCDEIFKGLGLRPPSEIPRGSIRATLQ